MEDRGPVLDWHGQRILYDTDSNTLVPLDEDSPASFRRIQIRDLGGRIEARIPMLAGGEVAHVQRAEASMHTAMDAINEINTTYGRDKAKADMAKARLYWSRDSIAYRCVELAAALANTDFSFNSKNTKASDLVTNWFKKAMPDSFREAWFREYFLSGLPVSMKTLIPYKPKEFDGSKPEEVDSVTIDVTRAVAARSQVAQEEMDQADRELVRAMSLFQRGKCTADHVKAREENYRRKQYQWSKNMIPGAYTILNPMLVDVKGPKEMPWLQEYHLQIDNSLRTAIANPTPGQATVIGSLPPEIISRIRAGDSSVWLSPNIAQVSFGDKQPYDPYPTPMLAHAFDWLAHKYDLLDMDRATAKNVKERILKVTVGNDQWPCFDPSQIRKIAAQFRSRSRGLALFWDHTLEIEWIEPNLDSLKDDKKYDYVDKMVRTCFGITDVLLGNGQASSGGQVVVNLKGVEKAVRAAQKAYCEMVQAEISMLRKAISMGPEVEVSARAIDLMDPIEHINLLSTMVQNGLLDHETALETAKYHFPTVVERMKKIKKLQKDEEIFLPTPSANNMGPNSAASGLPTGGRPAKQPGSDKNKAKRNTAQPKLKAAARVEAVGEVAKLVVDVDVLDPEMVEQLCEQMELSPDDIMSAPDFAAAYGREVRFIQPWPQLTTAEIVGAMSVAQKVVARVDQEIEAKAEAYRDEGDKKRYVTDKVRRDLRDELTRQALAEYRVDDPHWDDRFRDEQASLIAQEVAGDVATAMAHVVLAKRHQKLQDRAAAEAPSPTAAV